MALRFASTERRWTFSGCRNVPIAGLLSIADRAPSVKSTLPPSTFWQGDEASDLHTLQVTNRISRVGTLLSREVQGIAESLLLQDAEEVATERQLLEAEQVRHVSQSCIKPFR